MSDQESDIEHPAVRFNRWFNVGAAGDPFFPGLYDEAQLRGVCWLAFEAGRAALQDQQAQKAKAPAMAVDDEADDHVSVEEAMIGGLKQQVLALTTQLAEAKQENFGLKALIADYVERLSSR